jgi:hypothetical protein
MIPYLLIFYLSPLSITIVSWVGFQSLWSVQIMQVDMVVNSIIVESFIDFVRFYFLGHGYHRRFLFQYCLISQKHSF